MGLLSDFTGGFTSCATLFNFTILVSVWICGTAAYRLWFGPLAKFPGRKLAILTGWYETYFECFRRGRYWVEIEKMHEEYGPIIRISPWELHVNDPNWNELYKVSSKVDKYHWYYRFAGSSDAAFGTADYELHRIRRKAQQAYFTLDAVAKFEPVLSQTISKLSRRLAQTKGTGQPSNLSNAFRALATDLVTDFAFEKSYGLLDRQDFAATFHASIKDINEIGNWHRHFLIVLNMMESLPVSLVKILNPSALDVLDFFNDATIQAKRIAASYSPIADKNMKRTNVVHQMLDSPDLSAEDKEEWRLAIEVRTIVGAGTETTGNTLSIITYHLLSDPEKAKRLKEELQVAQRESSTPLNSQQLAGLPYLSAVVLEGHRITTSVSGRTPRVNTRETMQYGDQIIPINTPVSTTHRLTHLNPTIFSDPHTFIPDRWLDPSTRKGLEKHLHPFGKGSRSCIAIHLATSVLHLTLAKIFLEVDMKLFDTTEEDVAMFHDFFGPFPASDKGVRVVVV